jgi:transcriptional regulator with XRE-family HTH domain
MTPTEKITPPRMLTLPELATLVKVFREIRKWSQEQLADISGLSARTVQRVEGGKPSSTDARRALARAFEFEDIDALNKPYSIPGAAELKAEKEAFERDNVTLQAKPIASGRELATLAETTSMDLSEPAFEMPREAEEIFAELVDYFRDYRDCADMYSQHDKLSVYDELDAHIDALKALEISLCYATRKVAFKSAQGSSPFTTTALYVVACKRGKELSEFATPRAMKLG